MKPLGDALASLNLRRGAERPDPTAPEEIERWLIERNLWPTARIAADLAVAETAARSARGNADEHQAVALVERLKRDLELGRIRDRLQVERPDECWCFGIGGHSRAYVPTGDDEPLPSWRVWCGCEDAQRMRAELELRRAELERQRRQVMLGRLWGSLPAKYRDWSFGSLRALSSAHADLADQVERWLDEPKRWLFVCGPVGRGKTGVAVAALKALAERGQTGLFQETSGMLEQLRLRYASVEAFADSRDVLWESLFGVQVLLLDDLGAERHRGAESVDWATEKLWQLIGYRHREECRTIITSNLDLAELREHLGHARIPSRIDEVSLVLNCARLPDLRQVVRR